MATQFNEMYADIEQQVMPLIRRGARRLARRLGGHIHEDDAIQAGRIVLWNALSGYDANACNGDIERYVSRCLRNAYLSMYAKATAKRRMPQVVTRESVGYSSRPLPPIPTSMCEGTWEWRLTTGPGLDPQVALEYQEADAEVRVNIAEIRDGLTDKQKFIMDVVIDPPADLMELSVSMGGDPNGPPMQRAIVKWLDPLMTKNQVDNCLHMIRRAIIAHTERGQFSDAFAERVRSGWHPSGASKKFCKPNSAKRRVPPKHKATRRDAQAE
jgi:DNA-directed RNA polymerase specialized sigma24 family protein